MAARQIRPRPCLAMKFTACGRDLLGGDDEIALVLAILVVHDDDDLAGAQGRQGLLDGVWSCCRSFMRASFRSGVCCERPKPTRQQAVQGQARCRIAAAAVVAGVGSVGHARCEPSRAALTSTSISRFTCRPRAPVKVVACRVCGMRFTVKPARNGPSSTVRLTPSTATEPLGDQVALQFRAASAMVSNQPPPRPSRTALHSPDPVDVPLHQVPVQGFARPQGGFQVHTADPAASRARVVRRRVSAAASTLNLRPRPAVTVRQMPLHRDAVAGLQLAPRWPGRQCPGAITPPRGLRVRNFPISLINPVNMTVPPTQAVTRSSVAAKSDGPRPSPGRDPVALDRVR